MENFQSAHDSKLCPKSDNLAIADQLRTFGDFIVINVASKTLGMSFLRPDAAPEQLQLSPALYSFRFKFGYERVYRGSYYSSKFQISKKSSLKTCSKWVPGEKMTEPNSLVESSLSGSQQSATPG